MPRLVCCSGVFVWKVFSTLSKRGGKDRLMVAANKWLVGHKIVRC